LPCLVDFGCDIGEQCLRMRVAWPEQKDFGNFISLIVLDPSVIHTYTCLAISEQYRSRHRMQIGSGKVPPLIITNPHFSAN